MKIRAEQRIKEFGFQAGALGGSDVVTQPRVFGRAEVGDGGAYVANSTELVHFKDDDGDGKADSRRVVLSGFGTEDTHHLVHTLKWGPEGRLFFN